jgi:hypothetical protein
MTGDYLWEATKKLTGLDPERVREARERIQGFGIAHLTRVLVDAPSIDAAVAAVLLDDSVTRLIERGIERTKLLSKLRNDRDVWPTWAELRAAQQIASCLADGGELQLEPDRAQGRHADFRVRREGGAPLGERIPTGDSTEISIEFKALGLSEDEASFCQRARLTLDAMEPSAGFVTLHAPLDIQRQDIWINRARRREGEREAVRLARALPDHTRGLSGAIVVAQGAESTYLARLRARISEAFAQLPADHPCFVAFHWSNGAPFEPVGRVLNEVTRPENVLGIVLIGSTVAFPHPDIHHFIMWGLAREPQDEGQDRFYSEISSEPSEPELYSAVSEEVGRAVFDRVDRSAGVRASVVRASVVGENRPRNVLIRDGTQRILPCVLLIDPDPTHLLAARISRVARWSGRSGRPHRWTPTLS